MPRTESETTLERVLAVGIPRSGTTWVGHVLGHMEGATFLNEPDNHFAYPFAFRAKRTLRGGFHPALRPGDEAAPYGRLWRCALPEQCGVERAYTLVERRRRAAAARLLYSASQSQVWAAFGGQRPAARLRLAERLAVPERPVRTSLRLVVKSVYAALAVEWIAARHPVRVVVVEREPLNVLSSWSEMGWLGRPGDDMLDTLGVDVQVELAERWGAPVPPAGTSVFARAAWLIAALTVELRAAVSRNPAWIVVQHEDLADGPHAGFRVLADACGLPWGAGVDGLLESGNRPGRGYELKRLGSELRAAWRARLTPEQVAEARGVFERFALDG